MPPSRRCAGCSSPADRCCCLRLTSRPGTTGCSWWPESSQSSRWSLFPWCSAGPVARSPGTCTCSRCGPCGSSSTLTDWQRLQWPAPAIMTCPRRCGRWTGCSAIGRRRPRFCSSTLARSDTALDDLPGRSMTRTPARLASGLARGARPHVWPAALGLGLGLLALGPALGPGYVLTYDMVFVPDPPITAGLTGGPPRAFPSDLVVALAARIIPADSVQKLILIAILVLACAGAAALLAAAWTRAAGSEPHLVARLAAGACYAWNPFVAERLIMGQWAMLLGYAGLPWLLREIGGALGARLPLRVGLAAVPAAIGGFAAMSIT